MTYVYTTGAFDLFHFGHLRLLERAAEYGPLVVGIMSDEFIARTKDGPPIIPYCQRACIVGALECVDHVGMVTNHTDYNLIDEYPVDVRIIGPDYGKLPGHREAIAEMMNRGIEIAYLKKTPDISTTVIKEKIRGQSGCDCGCGLEGCRMPGWAGPHSGQFPTT